MSPELRNPEFEAEIEKNKHRRTYVKLGKVEAEDFTKTFTLNWTYNHRHAPSPYGRGSASAPLYPDPKKARKGK